MRIWTAALGLVALVAMVMSLGGALANESVNVSVLLEPNGDEDAGCRLGTASIPIGDFGAIIQDGDTWRGSHEVILSIPLSQDWTPGVIDCRIAIVAGDLAVAGAPVGIPAGHLAIAGCDLHTPISLAAPRAMTCSVDRHTTHIEVVVSLLGLDQQPAGALTGTIVLSSINGT